MSSKQIGKKLPMFVGLIIVGYLLTLTVVSNHNLTTPCFDPVIRPWQCPSLNQGLPLAYLGIYLCVFGFVSFFVLIFFASGTYPKERWLALGSILIALLAMLGVISSFGVYSTSYPIQLNSLELYAGPVPTSPTCNTTNSAYMFISLINPGFSPTNITKVTISAGTSANTTIFGYYVKPGGCAQISSSFGPRVFGTIIYHRIFFGAMNSTQLIVGGTYNYEIDFANSNSITGSARAQ